MICGKDAEGKDNAVIIELKQWDRCKEAPGKNEVISWVGGTRELLHPSVQVMQYKNYLKDTHTVFYEEPNPIILNSCAYLHNYNVYSEDVLFSEKFADALLSSPLFTADDVTKLSGYLASRLQLGSGVDVLMRIERASIDQAPKYSPLKSQNQTYAHTTKT